MSVNTVEIFKQFATDIVPELRKVSKRFADSIESEADEKHLTIFASPYISVLIDGRPPTRSGATKGSPTLQQIIRKWIDTKGIIPRERNGQIPTLEQLSWAISKSIHMKGDLLYQRGGGNNIFDGIITESRIDNLLNLIGEKYFLEVSSINLPTISK